MARIAPLVFTSGLCALIYQIAWTRDFRVIFGASTGASAAVLAIFMGGLGVGGILLGKRAERRARPLDLYARLELLVALSAGATPGLLWLARRAYFAAGGTVVLGTIGGSVLRLVLAALVLGAPTLLMGGTLPAAARAVASDDDDARRGLALLYGVNALGAVAGCLAANFFLLETLGTHFTLWAACLVNALVGITARSLARSLPPVAIDVASSAAPNSPIAPAAPRALVLAAAAIVGFAFFLMEIVWYRMLGPLLGGTIFTFGLILAVALLGIGVGGAAYGALFANRPARLAGFAFTCLLEAACIAVPYALGDRIALLALLVRPVGALGFGGYVLGWAAVTSIVVLPAAIVAGIQFPMLIALLGKGKKGIGGDVGTAYAFNTFGAIVGALAGGFGLLPLLSATGCWRLVVIVLVATGIAALLRSATRDRRLGEIAGALALVGAIVLLLRADGPTAAWRHSPIGAGRVPPSTVASPNAAIAFVRDARRRIAWQVDGVESSVAIDTASGYAFVIGGKLDGNARQDAATQVMGGLLGAALHPNPKSAMVIGLGTGSTAGWLGRVPSIDRVDVVELEPAILEVARWCAAVNEDVLSNPKVHVMRGDAREMLSVTRSRYDVVFSEPSNPYRAGIASLYTEEFYRSVAAHLETGGVFLQWVQAYEIDALTVRTIYATLASVFPSIETWQAKDDDLILVASMAPMRHDAAVLRARIEVEPFGRALRNVWRVSDLEGFFGHFIARPSFARALADAHRGDINTDDEPVVEFGFAKSLGRDNAFGTGVILDLARARHESLPDLHDLDTVRTELAQGALWVESGLAAHATPSLPHELQERLRMMTLWSQGDTRGAYTIWNAPLAPGAPPRAPFSLLEEDIVAELLAQHGDREPARRAVESLRAWNPTLADGLGAVLFARDRKNAQALAAFESAFARYRTDPWPLTHAMLRVIAAAVELGRTDASTVPALLRALEPPFALDLLRGERLSARVALARRQPLKKDCVDVLRPLEPWTPWSVELLEYRRDCYVLAGDPAAARAEDELAQLIDHHPFPFGLGVSTAPAH